MAAREWQIEVLRFTFIGLADEVVERFRSMQEFLSIVPETVTHKPQLKSSTEQVPWEKGTLSVVSQPGRLDVIYSALEPEAVFELPNAGEFSNIGHSLLSLISPISGQKVGRVACGGVVLNLVDDVKDGYAGMAELLPFVSFDTDMREFSLQVNKPTYLGDFRINELGKWSVASLRYMHLDQNQGVTYDVVGQSAVRLEFDFNTSEAESLPEDLDCYQAAQHLFERSLKVSQEGAR